MNDHPNKHIREAIDYALEHGWRLRKAGPRAVIRVVLLCPHAARDGCRQQVFSTALSICSLKKLETASVLPASLAAKDCRSVISPASKAWESNSIFTFSKSKWYPARLF